jgi:leucyl aminopeptidase
MLTVSFSPELSQDGTSLTRVVLLAADQAAGAARKLEAPLKRLIDAHIEAGRFAGKSGQSVEVSAVISGRLVRAIAVGVGAREELDAHKVERAVAGAIKSLMTGGTASVDVLLDAVLTGRLVAEHAARAGLAARLASYRFDRYRTTLKPEKRATLIAARLVTNTADAATARYASRYASVSEGVNLARELVNEPANVIFPESFAARIEQLKAVGVTVTVLGEPELTALGMHALLGVGQGSVKESKVAIMQWQGDASDTRGPLALVGKGVCFDTGGISLKPGDGMWDMKGDMGGAAAVTGAMHALAARKAKANVVGIVGLVENMPDADAQRPGDIVTSMSGQTIEVLNTDAEGRLVLCDLLTYVQEKHAPRAIVDLATLTGAILIALGHEHAGLFSNNNALSADILKAGGVTGETAWRFPLGAAYDRMIDTPNADMKNISGSRNAGSIVGAQFLARFIKDGTAWAHLDIAGTAWNNTWDDPRTPVWGSGWGVRLLDSLADAG